MHWKVVVGLVLAAIVFTPHLAAAQAVPEVTLEEPQLEHPRPSRGVLARRRAGWVLLVGSVPTFLVGYGILRHIHRNDETMEWDALANAFLPGVIAEGIFFTGMGLLIRSRRLLRRERASSGRRLAYDLDIGPLGAGLTVSF